MLKKLGIIALLLFVSSNAFALSIHIDLVDKDGKTLSEASCMAVSPDKKLHLVTSDKEGKIKLNNVQVKEFELACHKNGKTHSAKVMADAGHAKIKMEPKALIVMGDDPFHFGGF